MVDNLLPDHVGLTHVLDLAVHLVQLTIWMGLRGHPKTFSLLALFSRVLLHGPWDYGVSPVLIGLGF